MTTGTTGGFTSEGLAAEFAELELPVFGAGEAVALGLLATDRAITQDLAITIEVHHLGRLAYRAALPGSLPDSDDWIRRKRHVVERYRRSTLAVRVEYEERGTTFTVATGLDELEYAAHGGGVPLVVTGVGVVGGFYVSGLPQVDDHRFVVACLRDLKGS